MVIEMLENQLFEEVEKTEYQFSLGSGLTLRLVGGRGKQARTLTLFKQGVMVKSIEQSNRTEKRFFVVDAVGLGASKAALADALAISRQSIDNWLLTKNYFGSEGLAQGYNVATSKNRRKQREIHQETLADGNKVQLIAEIRARERQERDDKQVKMDFSCTETQKDVPPIMSADQPFAEEHGWEKTRYAGVFIYLITLVRQWNWLNLVMRHFGGAYRIFLVFVMMAATNSGSIEQLKNIRSREAGIVLGIRRIVGRTTIWEWFYSVAHLDVSRLLLADYFRYQIRSGLVGLWFWFYDGHLLPYTGKHRVRSAYNTQRRMPVPGRTNMVACDFSGRIVDFEIQEGKGDLRAHIVESGKKWSDIVQFQPVRVFDREGSGNEFFANLVQEGIPFVTWEKHADAAKLAALDAALFTQEFSLNDKQYGVFEENKTIAVDSRPGTELTLRRIYVLNKTSNRRASGLAWTGKMEMSAEECAYAILSRWGASENTFKHIKTRHPFHYHPGFKLVESDSQEIANPEIKKKANLIASIKSELQRLYKKLAKSRVVINKDGRPRENNVRGKLEETIAEQESALAAAQAEKKLLPERVDVSGLQNYSSIRRIDDEGKRLFDFVTSSVWNARKQMVDWLRPHFTEENEIVDLFYAITGCHGWIRSTKTEVTVRLEPLQQPRRRQAQEMLCRKLTNLGARTPTGKWLSVEVGEEPTTDVQKK
jgi:transposase